MGSILLLLSLSLTATTTMSVMRDLPILPALVDSQLLQAASCDRKYVRDQIC
jgi:hypothetical protein